MMREEFEKLVGKSVNTEEYEIIEKVYTWHPTIKDKEHIAKLYTDFGMAVIRAMVPVANYMIEIDEESRILKRKEHLLDVRARMLKEGDTTLEEMVVSVNDLFMKLDKKELFDATIEEARKKENGDLVDLALEIAGL